MDALPRLTGGGCLLGISLVLQGSTCTPPPLSPDEVLRHQRACQKALQQGDLEVAETRCRLCLEYDRGNPECLNLMGVMWHERSGCREARGWYKRALTQKPDFPEARVNLGVCFMEEQPPNHAEAITLFSSSIKIDPGYRPGRWNLAHAHARRGDVAYADATVKFSQSGLSLANPAARAFYGPAEADYARADDQLRRILELDPTEFRAYALLAYLEMQRSNYASTEEERRQHLDRSLLMGSRCVETAPPDAREAHECAGNLGAVHASLEQHERALHFFAACLALQPGDPECRQGVAHATAALALHNQSIRNYLQQVAQEPLHAPGYFNLCVVAYQGGIPDLATSACEQAIQLDPSLCLAHLHLAHHFQAVLDKERSVASCRSFVSCAGGRHPADVQECKDVMGQLDMQ